LPSYQLCVCTLAAETILRPRPPASDLPQSTPPEVTISYPQFVRLYQIRDALVKRFGSERDAKEALGVTTSDWKFYGQMANDEPVVEGRHRGKSLGPLRNATTDERARMRALDEDWTQSIASR
jgi:hypothetical protein